MLDSHLVPRTQSVGKYKSCVTVKLTAPVCRLGGRWSHRPCAPCPRCRISPWLSTARPPCPAPAPWSPPCPRPPPSGPPHPRQSPASTRRGVGRAGPGLDTLNTERELTDQPLFKVTGASFSSSCPDTSSIFGLRMLFSALGTTVTS